MCLFKKTKQELQILKNEISDLKQQNEELKECISKLPVSSDISKLLTNSLKPVKSQLETLTNKNKPILEQPEIIEILVKILCNILLDSKHCMLNPDEVLKKFEIISIEVEKLSNIIGRPEIHDIFNEVFKKYFEENFV